MALVQASSPLRTEQALDTISLPGVAAGNALIVVGGNYGSGFTSVTGSLNGTFLKAVGTIDDGNNAVECWYKLDATSGSETISFGVSSSTPDTYISARAMEWSGVASVSALDRTGTAAGSLTATASAANTQADALVIHATVCDTGASIGFGTPSGYTLLDRENDSVTYTGYQSAYKVVTAIETSSGTASAGIASSNFDSIIATFKLASGGTSPTTATAAAGAATVSGTGSSRAAAGGTAAAGVATVSATARAVFTSTATAANGAATVSASGAARFTATASAAAGLAAVSAGASAVSAATGTAPGTAAVSGSGAALAATTAVPAAGTATVSAVGGTEAAGQATAVPAAGTSVVSALASSLVAASAIPAAGSASVSATSPTVEGRTSGGSGGGKVRNRNYDYSSPKAEPVKAKVEAPKPAKKKQKAVSPDMVEMLALLDSSQVATAQVLAEQAAQRAEEQRMRAEQDIEDDIIAAIVAACL